MMPRPEPPVMPDNIYTRSLDQALGTRATVMPPNVLGQKEQYENDWGPGDTAVDFPVQQEDVGDSPPTPQSSAPPPLRGFLMIDLVRMVLIGDNMEEFPIIADESKKALYMFCREQWHISLNEQFKLLSESMGLPLPEMPVKEPPVETPQKKARKKRDSSST
jgi:hypothetical protein